MFAHKLVGCMLSQMHVVPNPDGTEWKLIAGAQPRRIFKTNFQEERLAEEARTNFSEKAFQKVW